jgi:hypothetical protein
LFACLPVCLFDCLLACLFACLFVRLFVLRIACRCCRERATVNCLIDISIFCWLLCALVCLFAGILRTERPTGRLATELPHASANALGEASEAICVASLKCSLRAVVDYNGRFPTPCASQARRERATRRRRRRFVAFEGHIRFSANIFREVAARQMDADVEANVTEWSVAWSSVDAALPASAIAVDPACSANAWLGYGRSARSGLCSRAPRRERLELVGPGGTLCARLRDLVENGPLRQ